MSITFDTFDRTDSATTLGSATVGGAWTPGNNGDTGTLPTWGISSNQAYLAVIGSLVDRYAWVESSLADCRITVTLTTASPEASVKAGIVFRRTDGSNFWMARINNSTDQLLVEKRVAGTVTAVDTQSVTIAAGAVLTLQVDLSGSSIITKVNGSTVSTVTDAALATATKHGIALNNTTGNPRFDDFLILNPATDQTVTVPAGPASAAAVGTPTVTVGQVVLMLVGIASTAAVGVPAVTPQVVTAFPAGIASTATVGVPTVLVISLISPAGIASTRAVGVPTITVGAVTLHPVGIPSSAHVGAVAIVVAAVLAGVGTLVASDAALGRLVASAASVGALVAAESARGSLVATHAPLAV